MSTCLAGVIGFSRPPNRTTDGWKEAGWKGWKEAGWKEAVLFGSTWTGRAEWKRYMLERHAAFGVGIPKRLRYLYWQRHQLFESEEADNAVQAALSAYAVPLAAALSVHHRLRREKFHVTSVSFRNQPSGAETWIAPPSYDKPGR